MAGKMLKFLAAWEGGLPSGEGESWEQKLNHAKEGCLIWHDALVWSLEKVSGFLAIFHKNNMENKQYTTEALDKDLDVFGEKNNSNKKTVLI